MTSRFASLLALALPLAALPACQLVAGASCTEMGCADGYSVDFIASSWPAGTYTVDLVLDGKAVTCTGTMPLQGTEADGGCSDPAVLIGLSGSAMPADQQSISGVIFTGTPKQVKITVSRDGTQLATADYAPKYVTSEPNGPDCPPVCTTAPSDKLALP